MNYLKLDTNNKKHFWSRGVVSLGFLSVIAFTGNVNAANEMCPQVSQIMAQSITPERGFTYSANAIRGGWKGENPGATESYLDKVQFTSAAIRQTTDNAVRYILLPVITKAKVRPV